MVVCPPASSDRLLRVGSEIMIERHSPTYYRVLLPLRRPPCECKLRFNDLLEHRAFSRLLFGNLVEDLELASQNRIRRLVELDLILRLQIDIVLRIAVDRLPLHVLRGSLDRIL